MPDMSLIDNISEALGNSDGQTPDEIREELRDYGVDIDTLEQRLLKYKEGLMGEFESNMKHAKSVGADISKPIEEKRCWYCCLEDYPNHTDSCPNNPKNQNSKMVK